MTRRPFLLLVLLLVLPAGCATTAVPVASTAAEGSHGDVDRDYMARVDQIATQRGVQVRWVNPPPRKDATPR